MLFLLNLRKVLLITLRLRQRTNGLMLGMSAPIQWRYQWLQTRKIDPEQILRMVFDFHRAVPALHMALGQMVV